VIVLQTPEDELRKSWFKVPDPGYAQDTVPWPKGDVLADTMPAGVNYRRLNELLDTCFDRTGVEPYKKTLGIAVVYKNQLIAERYLNGYDSNTLFHGWSMTKSLTGAWAGILAERGLLNLDEPVGVDIWKEDDRSASPLKMLYRCQPGSTGMKTILQYLMPLLC
jgi:CubicO group peptidase (beta-lactamase class C family)